MNSVSNPARLASIAAALLLVVASSAEGQTDTAQSTRSRPSAPSSGSIELTPAQPRQGSVVKITLRLPVDPPATLMPPATTADTMSRVAPPLDTIPKVASPPNTLPKTPATQDTLPMVTIGIAARLDSLRSVLDTLPLRNAVDSGIIAPDTSMVVRASLFGEPLHFHREPGGAYTALAAIPVDAPTAVNVAIVVARGAIVDTIAGRMAIRRTAYKMEKLTVAPRFGQAPDSALAARIAREQALAAEVSRKSHDTPRLWEGAFRRPRTARVTSAFGDGRQFNGKVQSRHMGLDLAGAVGAPVVAANRGVVALVGDFYYAGNAVYIDHGAGLVTAYFHLDAVDVAQGDTVTPGMRIGRVGATGRVTGPHLHWVARYGAVTVDPSTLLEIGPRDSMTPATPTRRDSTTARDSARATVSPPPRD